MTNIVTEDIEEVVCGAGNRSGAWEVEIPVIEQCSKAPAGLMVSIEVKAKAKIDALMEKFPAIEWLAYLIGNQADPLVVQDLYIPDQDVTSTSVDNIQCPEFNNLSVIGVIHSHHGMGTGFSGTDHTWINQNHNLSIVVAKDGIAGQMRWTTPCGGIKIIPVKCRVKYDLDFDKAVFLGEVEGKIKKKSYTTSYTNTYHYVGGEVVPLNKAQSSYVGAGSIKKDKRDKRGFTSETSLFDAINEAFGETGPAAAPEDTAAAADIYNVE